MTSFVFTPRTPDLQVSWDDPSIWNPGSVPAAPDAEVVLPDTVQNAGGTGSVYAIAIAAGQEYGIASLGIDDQDLVVDGTLAVAGSASLQDGGAIRLDGGTLSFGALAITAGGSVGGNGAVTGPIQDDGAITADAPSVGPARLVLDGPVTGTGTLVVGPDPDLENGSPYYRNGIDTLELGAAASVPVQFADAAGVLALADSADFTGTIAPAAPQYATNSGQSPDGTAQTIADTVMLSDVPFSSLTGLAYAGNAQGGTLTIETDNGTRTLRFTGDLSTNSFAPSAEAPTTAAGGQPTLAFDVTPLPIAPTIGLEGLTVASMSAAVAITNADSPYQTPFVTGTVPAGATVALFLDGQFLEDAPLPAAVPGATAGTYNIYLPAPPAPGTHTIDAVATNAAGRASAALSLLVLPEPVNGITTATVSSAQIAALLDRGAGMQFAAGTEAIRLTDGTLSVGPDTDQALVQRLYEGLLGRGGDTAGLSLFTTLVPVAGAASVATAILDSPEFARLHGAPASMGDADLVTLFYSGLLGREPDPAGFAAQLQALGNGASPGAIAAGIAQSPEAKTYLAAATANVWMPDPNGVTVTELHQTAFGRASDPAGLALFTGALQGGQTPQQLANDIAASPEFLRDHAGQDPAALVGSLYASGLGRTPEPGGLQTWVGALQAGVSTGAVLFGIATSPEAYAHQIRTV